MCNVVVERILLAEAVPVSARPPHRLEVPEAEAGEDVKRDLVW